MPLQFAILTYFRIKNFMAVRLAKSISRIGPFKRADGSALIYYDIDVHRGFHSCASAGTALDISDITGRARSRTIQRLTSSTSIWLQ